MKSEPEPRYNTRGRKIVVKPHDEKIFAKEWQKQILLKHFKENPYPDKKELGEIEKKVELDAKWLKNWYCFQRKNPSFRAEALKKGVDIKKEIDNDTSNIDSLTDGDNTNNQSIENRENHDVKDPNDEMASKFDLLQRQFDELQNKYTLMVKLLEEKSIIRTDEVNNVKEVDENNVENLQETVYHDAEENVTLTEASADATVVQADSVVTDPNQTLVKEEAPVPGYPAHPQFAPFPYPYPPYYPPPQGYIPYPPQFYPQPGQPQSQQPPQYPPMYPPPHQPPQGQQPQPQYPPLQPQGQPPQYPTTQQPQPPTSSGQFQPPPHYPPVVASYHPMHQQPPFQPPPQPQQQSQQQQQ